MMISRKSNKIKAGGRRRSKSEFENWIKYLKKTYGFSWDINRSSSGPSKAYRSGFLVTGPSQIIPRRCPNPHGPLAGAALSVVQMAGTFGTSTGVSSLVIVQNSATAVNGAIAFRLDDLDQVTTFSSLFDQYRIDRVHIRIRPRSNTFTKYNIASPNQSVPVMLAVADYDDSSTLSTASDYRQYGNVVEVCSDNSLDAIIEPSITPSLFASGAFSGYGVEGSKWIDIANVSVPHYGLKFYISALQASSTDVYAWEVMAWYTVSFRNVR